MDSGPEIASRNTGQLQLCRPPASFLLAAAADGDGGDGGDGGADGLDGGEDEVAVL